MPSEALSEFHAHFLKRAGAAGILPFAEFMKMALYAPGLGYYSGDRRRIGRSPDADFFTSSSLGPVFGELVAAACAEILGPNAPAHHAFVEIGADPAGDSPGGVLAGISHPFAGAVALGLRDALAIPRRAVVFSNELFDAQPCHRVIRTAAGWDELGVACRGGALVEAALPEPTPEVISILDRLPSSAPEGYRIDLPLAAAALAARIAALPWAGLFVAFDYGKPWEELANDTPAGTIRAYSRHRQCDDLLADPGTQDLTCHVCWDWIGAALVKNGFQPPVIESQEEFLVRHAGAALQGIAAAEAGRFSLKKLAMMHLLNPGDMGRKFQVLWARRDEPAP